MSSTKKNRVTASEDLARRVREDISKATAHLQAAEANYRRLAAVGEFVQELHGESKQVKLANHPKLHVLDHDPTPKELTGVIVQLRETIDDVRIQVARQLGVALELCETAINPTVIKPVKLAVKPVVRPITPTVLPKKPAAKKPAAKKPAKKPAEKPAPEPAKQPSAQPTPHTRLPRSVRVTPHEVTLNIGGHPVKELADQDAKDFLNNPKVFWYRATQFPDPRRFGVQPHVEAVKVVKRADPKFTRAPWTTSVTISVVGDDKKCDSWGMGVYTRNKAEQE